MSEWNILVECSKGHRFVPVCKTCEEMKPTAEKPLTRKEKREIKRLDKRLGL